MVQLKGHRSVGGMRASIYNAMPVEGVQALVALHEGVRGAAWLRRCASPSWCSTRSRPAGLWRGCRPSATRVGKDVADPGRDPGALGRPARDADPGQRARHRPRRRRHQQHPGEGDAQRGVPVFNAPGANANAVKELVLAGMLMAARNLGAPALRFVAAAATPAPDLDKAVEDGKKAVRRLSWPGQTLGIIGLGKIGCPVADAAIKLGMNVLGYDPEITVDAAWSLPSQVRARRQRQRGAAQRAVRHPARAAGGRHAPPGQRRQHRPDAPGAVLLNFSRDGVVGRPRCWRRWPGRELALTCDFPSARSLHGQPR